MLFLEACAEQVELRFYAAQVSPKTAVFKRKIIGLITRLFCAECSLPYFYMAGATAVCSGLLTWLGADGRFCCSLFVPAGFTRSLLFPPVLFSALLLPYACGSVLLFGGKMSPKVSVLIPVYNAEKYLEQCLASLSAQTFADFEIICLDDGSRDSSAKVLRTVMRREPRLRLIEQANAGVAAARNRLLAEARGKCAAFIDADDWVEPEYLQALYETAEKENADITKCFFKEFDDKTRTFQAARCSSHFYKNPGNSPAEKFLCGYYDSVVWGKLWRLDFLRTNKFTFLPGTLAEDMGVSMLGFCLAHKIAFVKRELYIYRKGVDGALTSSSENMDAGVLRNLLHLRESLQRLGKWDGSLAGEWIAKVVWGICNFRKFSPSVRKENEALLQHAWSMAEQNLPLCRGVFYWRWKLLFLAVQLCGRQSIFFWTRRFR